MCSSRENLKIESLNVHSPLPCRVEGRPYSYSDHEPVCAKFRISEGRTARSKNAEDEDCITALEESLQVFKLATKTLSTDKRKYLTFFALAAILLVSLQFLSSSSGILHYILVTAHVLLTLFAAYCLMMATVWNRIEKHGLLSGQLGVAVRLEELSSKTR